MSTQALAQIDVKPIESKLAILLERASIIVVRDQPSYIDARQIELDAKAYIKNVERELDPGIDSVKQTLDLLRNQKAKFVGPAKTVIEMVKGKAETWAAEEKRLAQAEEDRKNSEISRQAKLKADEDQREAERVATESRRERVTEINTLLHQGRIGKREAARLLKEAGAEEEAAKATAAAVAEEAKAAPPPRIAVKPSVPTVAGIKNQTYYYAEVLNEDSLISAFRLGTDERRSFLRQFITVDCQAVSKYARDVKDSKAVEIALPGVRAWSKG